MKHFLVAGFVLVGSMAMAQQIPSDEIIIRADTVNQEYLGCLSCTKLDPDSVLNQYGLYGSKYGLNSVANRYSLWGGKYSTWSACNEYAIKAPKVWFGDKYLGRFTVNRYMINVYLPALPFAEALCK
jgi:hypothetical protein